MDDRRVSHWIVLAMLGALLALVLLATWGRSAPAPLPRPIKTPAHPPIPTGKVRVSWRGCSSWEGEFHPNGTYRVGLYEGFWSVRNGLLHLAEWPRRDTEHGVSETDHYYIHLHPTRAGEGTFADGLPFRLTRRSD